MERSVRTVDGVISLVAMPSMRALAMVTIACAFIVDGATIRVPHWRGVHMAAAGSGSGGVATQEEARVFIDRVEGKGSGVFAADYIEAGAWICSYAGVLATPEECDVRYPPIPCGEQREPGLGEYVFWLSDNLLVDAQNSTHFSRFLNHAEHGSLRANVSERERRINFFATRAIGIGDELTFDYGMEYWRSRGGPLPSTDSRDYSAEAWAERDHRERTTHHQQPNCVDKARRPDVGGFAAESSTRTLLKQRTLLAMLTLLTPHSPLMPLTRQPPRQALRQAPPHTPVTPIELQATLMLEEDDCRAALQHCLAWFRTRGNETFDHAAQGDGARGGATACSITSSTASSIVASSVARSSAASAAANLDSLATAAVACVAAAAGLEGDGGADAPACCAWAGLTAPQGDALVQWYQESSEELALIRRWRARVPQQASREHDALLIACYILYKNSAAHRVSQPLPAALVNRFAAHMEAHRDEADGRRVILDVYAALEPYAPRRHVEELVNALQCWLLVGDGLVRAARRTW